MDSMDVERSSISGIVLHVEENDEQPSEVLAFRKNESRIIAVGRKPCQAASQLDPQRALFRCPVVSRKHAKITFTEYGNVYITDLHSHHGTHILHPGDLVSTPLQPEVPTVMADGDRITFGKSVGRDTYLVKPIVVRIELTFGGDIPVRAPSPPSTLLRADGADEANPEPQGCESDHDKAPNSGHYGVFLPSPESSSSSSDGDSDIQEISPPTSPRDSFHSAFAFARADGFDYSFGGRLQLLQRFLPPIHRLSPESSSLGPSFFGPPKQPPIAEVRVVGAVEEEDMELSSSRASSPANGDIDDHDDVAVIGAWPASPWHVSESPAMDVQREVIVISDDDGGSSPSDAPLIQDTFAGNQLRDEVEQLNNAFGLDESIAVVEAEPSQPLDNRLEAPEPCDATVTVDMSIIEAQVADTYTELNVLRAAHHENEMEFHAHAQETKDKLDALDAQMHSTQAALTGSGTELSTVQARLQELGDVMKLMEEHSAMTERLEELVKEVRSAKELLKETCALQRETCAQMAVELQAVKTIRAEASTAVAEAQAACTSAHTQAMEVVTSLKRKRDAMDEERPSLSDASEHEVVPAPKRRRAMRVVSAVARTATVATLGAVAAWGALAYS